MTDKPHQPQRLIAWELLHCSSTTRVRKPLRSSTSNYSHRLLKFLLRRGGAKDTILRVLFDAIKPGTQCELGVISQMFDLINHIYARRMLGAGMSPQGVVLPQFGSEAIVVNQSDMYARARAHTHTHTHARTHAIDEPALS